MREYLFPFVTDLHLRHSRPRCRIDSNYLESQLKDLDALVNSKKYKSKIILCAGDVLNKYDEPPMVINALYDYLFTNEKVLMTTIGQHDVHNHTIKDWHKTSQLSLLVKTGRANVLVGDEDPNCPKAFYRTPGTRIIGCGFDQDCTNRLLNGESIVDDPTENDIYLIHASIGDGSHKYIRSINDVSLVNPGLYLFGDIHPGFPLTRFSSGAIAVNPGSLAKQSIDGKNQPLVATSIYIEEGKIGVELTELYSLADRFVESSVKHVVDTSGVVSIVKEQISTLTDTHINNPVDYVKSRATSMSISDEATNKVIQEITNG